MIVSFTKKKYHTKTLFYKIRILKECNDCIHVEILEWPSHLMYEPHEAWTTEKRGGFFDVIKNRIQIMGDFEYNYCPIASQQFYKLLSDLIDESN